MWLAVIPYLRQWGPPALVATLPPIEETIWLDGSGAKKYPLLATARVRERLMRPGWTVAHRLGRSISRIASILLVPIITPPTGAMAPPIRPVPEPLGTMGTRSRRQSFTISTTSSARVGRATASGAPL